MHPRIQEAFDYLDTTRADLSMAVAGVPEEIRDQRPEAERWSVAEVLEHLAITEDRVGKLCEGKLASARAAGLGPETDTSSILDSIPRARILDRSRRATAPDIVQPHSEQNAAGAWSALQQKRRDLKSILSANDGLALGEITHEHPVLGVINMYQWLIFLGAHEARHTEQVREIGAGKG